MSKKYKVTVNTVYYGSEQWYEWYLKLISKKIPWSVLQSIKEDGLGQWRNADDGCEANTTYRVEES